MKPGSLPPSKEVSRQQSAASLSRKTRWTHASNTCSSPDAYSLDCSRRRGFRGHQELSRQALSPLCGTDRADDLPAYPLSWNSTQPRQTRPPERHKRTDAYAAPLRGGLRGDWSSDVCSSDQLGRAHV